jgi:hypothetical protein
VTPTLIGLIQTGVPLLADAFAPDDLTHLGVEPFRGGGTS